MPTNPHPSTHPIEAISPTRKAPKISEPLELPALPLSIQQPFLMQTTLAPSTQVSITPMAFDRPRLAPPEAASKSSSEYRYLHSMDTAKDLSNTIMKSMSERFKIHKRKIEKFAAEHLEKLKENADKVQSSEWWSMLKKAATALLSALSLALGLALIAGGGSAIAGGALIASGILSLVNFTCAQAGVWDEIAKQLAQNDEERRKKIGTMIPIAVGIVSAGLGLFGGVQSMAFTSSFLIRKALSIVQTALAAFQGVTTIGQGIAHADLLYSQADMLKTSSALNEERVHFQAVSQWIENFRAEMKIINEKANQMANMIIQANQKIVEA